MHLMIDGETLSTSKRAAFVQLGGVMYDPTAEPGTLGEEFEINFNIGSVQRAGMELDGETIMWWMRQSQEARDYVFGPEDRFDAKSGLRAFRQFWSDNSPKAIWSHGSTFDIVILEEFYRMTDSRAPFSFRDACDTRTILRMVGGGDWSGLDHYGPKHGALPDAKRQAVVIQRAMRTLKVDWAI